MTRAVDLFAGAGGWDIAAKRLGIETFGVEIDADAYATQVAAGHVVFLGDVRAASDAMRTDFVQIMDGLIASPPCQTFSAAGKGAGRKNLDLVLGWAYALAEGVELDYSQFEDERTGLVLEPLRWILDAYEREQMYEWIALEQVPAVLPVWKAYSDILLTLGYSTDVGLLHAEQYGVPQTRKRAILVAHRSKPAKLPTPTYSRYHSRTPDKVDPGTEKWISMAEWLGWGMTHRPYPVIASSRTTGGPDKEKVGGSEARAAIYRERDAGRWVVDTGNFTAVARDEDGGRSKAGSVPYERDVDAPAPTVTGASGRWSYRSNTSENATVRDIDEPAPTLHFGDRLNKATWESMGDRRASRGTVRGVDEPAPTVMSSMDNGNYQWSANGAPGPGRWVQRRNSGPGAERTPRPVDEAPSYTIRANGSGSHPSGAEWAAERPATTVQSTDRIGRPGHKCMTEDCHPGKGTDNQFDGSVRVSLEEAAALQTFPPGYPFQGTKTSKFRQIGNAIPPVLAYAILAELIKE
jgi:DNA (cytosine-5)-methyltransferase 1